MTSPLTLLVTPLEDSARNYAFLRREGIRHLERMAGGLWSDFNAHDPGITILEQLCYAITDLAYRCNYEIPDLLAEPDNDSAPGLYGPSQALPSNPVTLTDLRKLVLDVDGVRNAWIEPVEDAGYPQQGRPGETVESLAAGPAASEPVSPKGRYRVLIEKSYIEDRFDSEVRGDVVRHLQAHRSLCEDFEEIEVLPPQPVWLKARVEIGAVEDAEEVLRAIYERVSEYVAPSVRFLSLQEILATGKAMDEIFDGPLLTRGFIEPGELDRLRRRSALHTSDVVQEIMSVPGVRAVRSIGLAKGEKEERWSLDLDPTRTPKLDLGKSSIALQRDGLPITLDLDKVRDDFASHRSRTAARRQRDDIARQFAPPSGRDRQVGHYHSIQHQFPALYGIGEVGLPSSASPRRKAQAKQLKAYLMFFDQLLANYFAQLAHAKDLFSFDGEAEPTYFAGMIEDPRLGLDQIRKADPETHRATLQRMTEAADSGDSFQRKNRFLNHLLARFAEQFTDYSLVLYGAMQTGADRPAEKLVRDKQAFLQRYPRISGARGTAFNYLEPRSEDNRSGLEERIALKLGLVAEDGEEFLLVEHILLRPMEGADLSDLPILAETGRADPYSLQLSFVFPEKQGRFEEARFAQFVERAIRKETPAHLCPHVHWLDDESMKALENAYEEALARRRRQWLPEPSDARSES